MARLVAACVLAAGLLLEPLPAGEGPAPAVSFFPHIGAGEAGPVRFHTDMVFVNSGPDAGFLLEVFDSRGEPWPLTIFVAEEEREPAARLELPLPRGHTLNLRLRWPGPLAAGYARVTTSPVVRGVAAYTQLDVPTGRIQYQAGVPASGVLEEFSLPVKYAAGLGDMALAVVNTSPEEARLTLRFYDEAFRLFGTLQRALPAGHHEARFLAQYFPRMVELARGGGLQRQHDRLQRPAPGRRQRAVDEPAHAHHGAGHSRPRRPGVKDEQVQPSFSRASTASR